MNIHCRLLLWSSLTEKPGWRGGEGLTVVNDLENDHTTKLCEITQGLGHCRVLRGSKWSVTA